MAWVRQVVRTKSTQLRQCVVLRATLHPSLRLHDASRHIVRFHHRLLDSCLKSVDCFISCYLVLQKENKKMTGRQSRVMPPDGAEIVMKGIRLTLHALISAFICLADNPRWFHVRPKLKSPARSFILTVWLSVSVPV